MLIALTGTPGVGKSTVAEILKRRGYNVFSANELAEKFKCMIGEEEGSKVIDTEKLAKEIRSLKGLIIIEGHLSHLLNPDLVIVLRCNPIELKKRLEKKGWNTEKILENVEAEIVDVILIEALDNAKEVYEIDATNLSPKEVADAIEEILKGHGEKFRPGKVDWISEVDDFFDDLIRKS